MGMNFEEFLKQYAKTIQEKIEKKYKEEKALYFDLIEQNSELQPYINTLSENMMKLEISDQIKVMKKIVEAGELYKELCEKYGFEVDL